MIWIWKKCYNIYLRGYSWVMMMTAVTIAMISIRSMMGRSLVGWKMMRCVRRRRWWWISRGCCGKLRVSGRLRRQWRRRRRKPTTVADTAATSTKRCNWCFQRRFERGKHVQMMSWWPMRGIFWWCCAQWIILVARNGTEGRISASRYVACSGFRICR